MAIVKDLTGSGIAGGAAQAVVGSVEDSAAATGAAQGGQVMPAAVSVFTSGTLNYGPTLGASNANGDTYVVANQSGASINVWPPVGGAINGGSTNAAEAVADGTVVTFTKVSALGYIAY